VAVVVVVQVWQLRHVDHRRPCRQFIPRQVTSFSRLSLTIVANGRLQECHRHHHHRHRNL